MTKSSVKNDKKKKIGKKEEDKIDKIDEGVPSDGETEKMKKRPIDDNKETEKRTDDKDDSNDKKQREVEKKDRKDDSDDDEKKDKEKRAKKEDSGASGGADIGKQPIMPNQVGTSLTKDALRFGDSSGEYNLAAMTVSRLAELLQIKVDTGSSVGPTSTSALRDLDDVQLELPQRVTKLNPILFFKGGDSGWCVVQDKWDHARTPFTTRDELLVRMRHICEKLTKDLFRVYSIGEEATGLHSFSLNPFEIGFDKSILDVPSLDVRGRLETAKENLFRSSPRDAFSSTISVVIPPAIQGLASAIQNFMFTKREFSRDWIRRFCIRKDLSRAFGANPPSNDNRVIWISSSDPSRIYEFMSLLPNINQVSILYSLPFVMPAFSSTPVDMAVMAGNAGVSLNRLGGVATIINLTATAGIREDIKRVIAAMVLPSQIMIEPNFLESDAAEVQLFSALACKMFLSNTPGFRNVTTNGMKTVDGTIGNFLSTKGYVQIDRCTHPLSVKGYADTAREETKWRNLETTPQTGWVNTRVKPSRIIRDPLYPNVSSLPEWGGVSGHDDEELLNFTNEIPPPPILNDILTALMSGIAKEWKTQLHSILKGMSKRYINTLGQLNNHILRSGEVGFRMSLEDRLHMEDIESSVDYSGMRPGDSKPQVISVNAVCFLHMLKLPITSLTMNSAIQKQPMLESQISAELQILYSSFTLMSSIMAGANMTNERNNSNIMELVLNSSLSNHYSKQMIRYCTDHGLLGLVNWTKIKALADNRFDALEARFMSPAYRVAKADPELFGLTHSFVRIDETIDGIDRDTFLKHLNRGILASTCKIVPNPVIIRQSVFLDWLRNGEVIWRCKKGDGAGRVILPVWVEYEEKTVTKWEPEVAPIKFTLCEGKNVSELIGETYSLGKFTNQFMIPTERATPPSCKDAVYINSVYRSHWHVGGNVHTHEFDPNLVFGKMLRSRVVNWKSCVQFRHAMEIV